MFIVKHRNIFFAITAALTVAAFILIFTFGLKPGLDFTGGVLVEVQYNGTRPAPEALTNTLVDAGFKGISLRESGDNGYTLRAAELSVEQRANLSAIFSYQGGTASIERLTEVGPTIGKELRNKSFVALGLVLLCILLFIAFIGNFCQFRLSAQRLQLSNFRIRIKLQQNST